MEKQDQFKKRIEDLLARNGQKLPEGTKIVVEETTIGPNGEESTRTVNLDESILNNPEQLKEGAAMVENAATSLETGSITIVIIDNDTDQIIQANMVSKASIGPAGQLGVPIAFAAPAEEEPGVIKETAAKVANGATTVAKAAVVGAETAGKGILGALASIKQGFIDAGDKYDERQAERAQKRVEDAQKAAAKLKNITCKQ